MLTQLSEKQCRIRSFVGRNSRTTPAQAHARDRLWDCYGLDVSEAPINLAQIFGNDHPCYLEIGFGMGQSLLAAAQLFPEKNFIGVEPHQPGVGSLLMHAEMKGIKNLRVFSADVIDVLQKSIPNHSLAGVQIFFPDPWQKRRHHVRRLVQSSFLTLICEKLVAAGSLHLATDWDDYAQQMMEVLTMQQQLKNVAGVKQFAPRSPFRPVITKFENRAIKEARSIWELSFTKD